MPISAPDHASLMTEAILLGRVMFGVAGPGAACAVINSGDNDSHRLRSRLRQGLKVVGHYTPCAKLVRAAMAFWEGDAGRDHREKK